jgi:hypothetical protein
MASITFYFSTKITKTRPLGFELPEKKEVTKALTHPVTSFYFMISGTQSSDPRFLIPDSRLKIPHS